MPFVTIADGTFYQLEIIDQLKQLEVNIRVDCTSYPVGGPLVILPSEDDVRQLFAEKKYLIKYSGILLFPLGKVDLKCSYCNSAVDFHKKFYEIDKCKTDVLHPITGHTVHGATADNFKRRNNKLYKSLQREETSKMDFNMRKMFESLPTTPCISSPQAVSFFLEDLPKLGLIMKNTVSCVPKPKICYEDISVIVMWINQNKPAGAILVFLPGWAEIEGVKQLLEEKMDPKTCWILPLHPHLPPKEQDMVFTDATKGIRKVILATNMAETIDIKNVRYVVDTGAIYEERLNTLTGLSVFDNFWISQTCVELRRERAEHIEGGECYHLYTKEKYKTMDKSPIPEILRVPVEKTVLSCKVFSEEENVAEFISQMIDPPPKASIHQAIKVLTEIGALDANENLTVLGRRISSFSTHPKISKALVHATILKCLSPVLTISTILTYKMDLFICTDNAREIKSKFHQTSDHVSIARIYEEWEKLSSTSMAQANEFCKIAHLRKENLEMTKKLRRVTAENLHEVGLLQDLDSYEDLSSDYNQYSSNDELVKAVLLSGFNNILVEQKSNTESNQFYEPSDSTFTTPVSISSESVNSLGKWSSPFLMYYVMTKSSETEAKEAWDTTVLSPCTLVLFKEGVVEVKKVSYDDDGSASDLILNVGDGLEMPCCKSDAKCFLEIRSILKKVLNYLIANVGHVDNENYKTVSSFRDKLLKFVVKVLQESNSTTDRIVTYPTPSFQILK